MHGVAPPAYGQIGVDEGGLCILNFTEISELDSRLYIDSAVDFLPLAQEFKIMLHKHHVLLEKQFLSQLYHHSPIARYHHIDLTMEKNKCLNKKI